VFLFRESRYWVGMLLCLRFGPDLTSKQEVVVPGKWEMMNTIDSDSTFTIPIWLSNGSQQRLRFLDTNCHISTIDYPP
jgi:hypothetical protein